MLKEILEQIRDKRLEQIDWDTINKIKKLGYKQSKQKFDNNPFIYKKDINGIPLFISRILTVTGAHWIIYIYGLNGTHSNFYIDDIIWKGKLTMFLKKVEEKLKEYSDEIKQVYDGSLESVFETNKLFNDLLNQIKGLNRDKRNY